MIVERYTPLAKDIARWLASASDDGRTTAVHADLTAIFAGRDPVQIEMALWELAYDGLVTFSGPRGSVPLSICPTYRLFAYADPAVIGNSPLDDAVTIARQLLADPANAEVATLFQTSGWSHRRFNPALGLLIEALFKANRCEEEAAGAFATSTITIGPAQEFAIRRFIRDGG